MRKHYSPERRGSEPRPESVEASVSEKRRKQGRGARGTGRGRGRPRILTGSIRAAMAAQKQRSEPYRRYASASHGKASVPREIT